MRIRFIEPAPAGHHVYDRVLLPRLGNPLMATVLRELGHDTRCYCEVLAPVDVADCLDADLVGISGTTATQPVAYRLADEFEAAGVPVVLGGSHVSFLPDEALEHARYVVRGEGQRTIVELVDALERGAPLTGVAGLSWRDGAGRTSHNPPRRRCTQAEFEALPIPDLSLVDGHRRMTVKPAMTQWGCPYDCEFCAVTPMFSRTVRYRRADQVVAELAGLHADTVFFHDDLFVVNRDRTRRLLHAMIEQGVTPDWLAQVRAQTVFRPGHDRQPDHELLRLMRDAGCWMVMVGFESIDDRSLAQINKKQTVNDITAAVELFHQHSIAVHGMFVAGIDTDPPGQAQRTAAFAERTGIDTIQLMIETPLPGTRLYDRVRAEHRLLTDDWSRYDGHHTVMWPTRTHPLQLQREVLDAMSRFYALPRALLPGLRAAVRHAPDVLRAALHHRSPSGSPALSSLALRHQWSRLLDRIQAALPEQAGRDLRRDLFVPALRAYGHRQLAAWRAQPRTRAHLDLLATLEDTARSPVQGGTACL